MSVSIEDLTRVAREFKQRYTEMEVELNELKQTMYNAHKYLIKAHYQVIKKVENKENPTLRLLKYILSDADILKALGAGSSELDELYGMCNRLLKSVTSSPILASTAQDVLNMIERFLESEGFVN